MTLSPQELADAWYRADTPADWWVGRGDLFQQLPYMVRDELGLIQGATALGICRDHECDVLGPRPEVVQRKISGGTRSPAGTTTFTTLQTLFGTWRARNLDPLVACRQMLRAAAQTSV